MEEKKRGNGIFLGVVAVATLIVAIIGATFAYFSITAQSDANAINLSAYEFTASLSVNPVYPTGTYKGLIPMDPNALVTNGNGASNLEYAINTASSPCVDSNGYQVCAVYRLTFTNTASEAMTLSGTLRTQSNNAATEEVDDPNSENPEDKITQVKAGRTPFTDLKVRTATLSGGTYTFDTEEVDSATVTLEREVPDAADGTVEIGDVTVQANSTADVYVVIFLDGTNDGSASGVDQSAQMGASYEGQLIYESGAGNQLTGTFTVVGP